ncbi:MAG: CAP domain-containing protein [Pararhizobium sp.]
MTRARRIFPFALIILAGAGLAACSTLKPEGGVTGASIVSDRAIASVNAFRADHGEPPLQIDRRASKAALAQAKTMASHQVMEHNIGFGANFAHRMKKDDVPLPAGENIASGQQTVDAAITAWENSPPHRRNMLDGRFKSVGVAVARSAETGLPYWSMVLTGG